MSMLIKCKNQSLFILSKKYWYNDRSFVRLVIKDQMILNKIYRVLALVQGIQCALDASLN